MCNIYVNLNFNINRYNIMYVLKYLRLVRNVIFNGVFNTYLFNTI